MSSASSIARWCISDQNILLIAPRAATPGPSPGSVADSERRPLTRRIWNFAVVAGEALADVRVVDGAVLAWPPSTIWRYSSSKRR